MSLMTLQKFLVQIFCDFMLKSEVIFKIVIDPDDTSQGDNIWTWKSIFQAQVIYIEIDIILIAAFF